MAPVTFRVGDLAGRRDVDRRGRRQSVVAKSFRASQPETKLGDAPKLSSSNYTARDKCPNVPSLSASRITRIIHESSRCRRKAL